MVAVPIFPPQVKISALSQVTSIDNLYLVGHWCAMGSATFGDIPSVAFSGRRASRLILEKLNKRWSYSESRL